MATTTPNYGWTVPTSTDLVKDGATAIETLGDAIDASLVDLRGGTTGQILKKASNTQMDFEWGAAGGDFVKIASTSYSAVSSQAFDSVFSATYRAYIVEIRETSSTNNLFTIRYRASGATDSTSNYSYQRAEFNSTTVSASRSLSNDSYGPFAFTSQTHVVDLLFVDPYGSNSNKGIHARVFPGAEMSYMSGKFNTTTSFDGFIIIANTGTITGTCTIWGLAA